MQSLAKEENVRQQRHIIIQIDLILLITHLYDWYSKGIRELYIPVQPI